MLLWAILNAKLSQQHEIDSCHPSVVIKGEGALCDTQTIPKEECSQGPTADLLLEDTQDGHPGFSSPSPEYPSSEMLVIKGVSCLGDY